MSLADARCSKLVCASLSASTSVEAQQVFAGALTVESAGTAPICGRANLAAGTATVATTAAQANSVVLVSAEGTGANDGFLHFTITPGVSLTIASSNALDDRTVCWLIVAPM